MDYIVFTWALLLALGAFAFSMAGSPLPGGNTTKKRCTAFLLACSLAFVLILIFRGFGADPIQGKTSQILLSVPALLAASAGASAFGRPRFWLLALIFPLLSLVFWMLLPDSRLVWSIFVWAPALSSLALALWWKASGSTVFILRLLSTGLFLMAVSGPDGLSHLMISESRGDTVEWMPYELVRILLMTAAAAIVPATGLGLCHSRSDGFLDPHRHLRALAFAVLMMVILAVGGPAASIVSKTTEGAWKRQLEQEAMLSAASFSSSQFEGIAVDGRDIHTATYEHLKSKLRLIASSGDGFQFAYLMIQREGIPVFIADSEPVGSPDESLPGDAYYDASEGLKRLFHSPRVVTEGPLNDRWGTWISGFAPVPHVSLEGSPVILGLDYDAALWQANLFKLRFGVMGLVSLFALLGASSFVLLEIMARGRMRQLASEERLRMSLQGARLGSWQLNPEEEQITLDGGWSPLIGTSPSGATLNCREFLEIVHAQDRDMAENGFRQLCESGGSVEMEFRVRRPADGSYAWVLCRGKATGSGARSTNIGGFILDITQRKEAFERLQIQTATLESTANAIVITSASGIIEWVNPAFEKLTGFKSAEAIGQTPRILKSGEHSTGFYKELWSTILSGKVWTGEITNRRKDGTLFYEETTITPVQGQDGRISRFIAVKQDITARKEVERELGRQRSELQRLALVAENTTNAVILTNTEGLIEWVNAGFTRITGFTADEVVGKKPGSMLQGTNTDLRVVSRMREAVAAGRGFRETLVNYSKSGQPYWISIECAPLKDADGNLTGFMAIEQDITARVKAEQALETQRTRLQRINSALLTLGDNYHQNLEVLTRLAGEIFDADCAIYSRLEGDMLVTGGRYKTPSDYPDTDSAHGHLCFDVIRSGERFLYVENLQKSPYYLSDPNVSKYSLETYIGQGVKIEGQTLGSLCVVFQRPFELTGDLRDALAIVAQAVGREELLEASRRKLAALSEEEAAQQSRFSTLLTNMEEAVLVEDRNRVVTFVNPAFEHMFQLSPEKLLGSDCRRLAADAAGYFLDSKGFLTSIDEALVQKRPSLDQLFETVDGRFLSRDFVPIVEQNLLHGYLWQYRDITLSHRTQMITEVAAAVGRHVLECPLNSPKAWEKLVFLFGSPLGLQRASAARFRSGPQGRLEITVISAWDEEPSTRAMPANPLVPPGDEAPPWFAEVSLGKTVVLENPGRFEVACGLATPRCRKAVFLPLMVSGRFWGLLTLETHSPARTWLEEELSLLNSAAHLVGSRLDLQKSERDLRSAKEEADLANRAKSTFLATMSHEIRTPLNAVIGMTSLLLTTRLDEQQKDFAQTVATSSESLLDLINDILDYSKIDAGHIEIEEAPFVLSDVVVEPLEMLARQASDKGLELSYFLDPSLPGAVAGDRARLRQVLLNLLSNAVKFTANGGVTLEVGLDPTDDKLIRFSVSDTGIGISPEVQEKLFKPFVQADSSVTRRFGGTGLGLAISQRLVELMGGKILITSCPGEGSTFYFSLPLKAAEPDSVQRNQTATDLLSGKRVLIVDDNRVNRQFLHEQTLRWGMIPREAAGGEEALEVLAKDPAFDFILCDFQMPGMDGVTLAGKIRQMDLAISPRVLLLSSVMDAVPVASKALFDGVMNKPLRPRLLREVLVNSWFGGLHGASGNGVDSQPGAPALRVLVAEDNLINQKVIAMMLHKLGIKPEIVADGRAAVEAVKSTTFDAVFLDIQMAVLDGLQAAREIRAHYDAIHTRGPILIALTANAFRENREECFAAGMDYYLPKPITLERLQATLLGLEKKE